MEQGITKNENTTKVWERSSRSMTRSSRIISAGSFASPLACTHRPHHPIDHEDILGLALHLHPSTDYVEHLIGC